jgi:predicted 3-demethylubiquinone-9 3-methyltransferase (glyoxalase superfamily)
MQKITPMLWFDNNAEEAVEFYKSVFKKSDVGEATINQGNAPGEKGKALVVPFELFGQNFIALNGGPMFKFNESVSFVINCEDQKEIDYYWEKLTSGGGQESMCGWLKDKYGLSWQVTPTNISKLMSGKHPEKAKKVMDAVMKMRKLDIKTLEEAYENG